MEIMVAETTDKLAQLLPTDETGPSGTSRTKATGSKTDGNNGHHAVAVCGVATTHQSYTGDSYRLSKLGAAQAVRYTPTKG